MKVCTIVRTLNEQRNIRRFIHTHLPFSDEIIVADGGSTDATLDICKEYYNVVVFPFHEKVEHKDGTFRNPEGKHMNFLIETAEKRGADWIVQNDCDDDPNPALQQKAREFFNMPVSIIKVVGLYVYKWDKYFPSLNDFDNPEHIWAWHTDAYTLRCKEDNTTSPEFLPFNIKKSTLVLPHPPFAVLNHTWQDEEQIERKRLKYIQYGWTINHPESRCGAVHTLPDWVTSEEPPKEYSLTII